VAEKNRKPPPTLAAVVLAAGQGKRLRSRTPKVLHPVCGRPMLWHVLQLVRAARPTRIAIVIGHGADDVREAVRSWGISPEPVFVEQIDQLGTGHAVLQAEHAVGRAHDVLVANGDLDPVRPQDVRALIRAHRRRRSAATVILTELGRPTGYGRAIVRGDRLLRVVEQADATPTERRIHLIATNWIAFRREDLFRALPAIGRDNRQGEYYLNDVYPILIDKGETVTTVVGDTGGVMGANSRSGLAELERVFRGRINDAHMAAGVRLVDPAATYIDAGVRIGRDTTIWPHTFLEGDTSIGRGCVIGPSVSIKDATIGDRSTVRFAVVEGARVGRDAGVGPFARLRPGTRLADHSFVGSYVEVKNSRIGARSKVPHLSYVGDATVGRDANIGAANVTANWDGYEKHRTVIGDDVRTGSDTIMVAPVRLGRGAVTGAGSVISKDVPPGALAVERTDQRVIRGYRKRKDQEHADRERRG
jgi:bifunctional UDP-N-acetylglucosamine pyrophosphorylase/glucosamine-1-phosphate N-acetyltransferase